MKPDSSRVVYDGDYLAVSLERWNGREREIVERPDVVAVLSVDRDGMVTFVSQPRPPARRVLIELPAGRIEPGEEPLAAARRELEEETGLSGGRWLAGRRFWSTPGFCRERVHLFVAVGVERGSASPAEDEEIEVVRVPVAELDGMLAAIEDAKTLVGVLLYLEARA